MTILLLFKYQSKLYNCVLARNIRIKTKAPVTLTGAPLLGLAKSISVTVLWRHGVSPQNIVGCLLKKGLQRGGHGHPRIPPSLRPCSIS